MPHSEVHSATRDVFEILEGESTNKLEPLTEALSQMEVASQRVLELLDVMISESGK